MAMTPPKVVTKTRARALPDLTDHRSFGLDQWLEHIQRQHFRSIDLRLDRIESVWERLGGEKPPLVITVAGTNGKGSSVAMLEAVLRRAGRRTGSYTSPHLVRYNERIRIDGEPAGDEGIIEAFRRIEDARGGTGLTYFEYGTLCALLVFQQQSVDVALLETGMGGRLDAVNIIANDLALITSIGLDHQQWLGSDREQIGREKAGIIKPGARVVCTDPAPPTAIAEVAAERGALLLQSGQDYRVEADGQSGACRWSSDDAAVPADWRRLRDLPVSLPGDWQVQNLGGVIAALALTADRSGVTPAHLADGLSAVSLAGRCQVLPGHPLTIIDVAHNEDSAAGLARFLDANPVAGVTHGVFGVLADKALENVLSELGDRIDHWHLAGIAGERGQSAESLAQKMLAWRPGLDFRRHEDAVAAFRGAREVADVADRIVAFGSFFIVGDIIAALEPSAQSPDP